MPKGDPNAIRLTKKYVVCSKHNKRQEDFPRFEEKATSFSVPTKTSGGLGSQQQSAIIDPSVVSQVLDPSKQVPKKRGRKPRSHYLALEAAAAAQKQAAESNAAPPTVAAQ